MWAILDSKDEEAYYHLLRIIKDIISQSHSLLWNLSSVTLDFEQALLNAFRRVFPETHIIGCLFHFKQALDDIGSISYDSLQQWYDWYFGRRPYQQCEICLKIS